MVYNIVALNQFLLHRLFIFRRNLKFVRRCFNFTSKLNFLLRLAEHFTERFMLDTKSCLQVCATAHYRL